MPVNDTNAANASASIKRDVICYTCNEVGHTSKFHRTNKQRVKATQSKKVVNVNGPMDEIENYEQTHFIIPCYLFDREVCAIRDSGSQMTLVAPEFIDQGTAIRQPVTVQCVFGTIKPVYLTEIKIRSPRFGTDEVITVKAGVVDGLSPPLVLGHDIFVQNKTVIDPVVPNKAGIQSAPNEVIREVKVATRKTDYAPAVLRQTSELNPVGDKKVGESDTLGATIAIDTELVDTRECRNAGADTTDTDVRGVIDGENDLSQMLPVSTDSAQGIESSDVRESKLVNLQGKIIDFQSFKAAQIADPSLAEVWIKARQGHPRLFINNGLLFAKDINADLEAKMLQAC